MRWEGGQLSVAMTRREQSELDDDDQGVNTRNLRRAMRLRCCGDNYGKEFLSQGKSYRLMKAAST